MYGGASVSLVWFALCYAAVLPFDLNLIYVLVIAAGFCLNGPDMSRPSPLTLHCILRQRKMNRCRSLLLMLHSLSIRL